MSYEPPMPSRDPNAQSAPAPQYNPNYESPGAAPKIGMALTAMILGIVGLATGCLGIGIILGLVGLILGIISYGRINREPNRYAGKGFAITGIITGILSVVGMLPLLVAILLPSLGRSRELSNRSYCAANLRGIVQSMNIYAADNNDVFPVLPANAGSYISGVPARPVHPDAEEALKATFAAGPNGDVLQAQWILVLKNQVSTKQYICKSDPFATSGPAPTKDAKLLFYNNFQAPNQISYSAAYPYTNTGDVGRWWTALTDSSLPVMSDMAPAHGETLNGTTINVLRADPTGGTTIPPKSWNSPNHGGDGQNIAFSDVHVEWARKPTYGQNNENIFAGGESGHTGIIGSTAPTYSPTGAPLPGFSERTSPFDTIMVPVRTSTGAIR